ncbi:unnamed protein product [Eruca vesicaria subsp. sativa]|uniref:Uncharacterized protein n=1 Tax=Eruca vesicaria subsp. sativa TaxID=29727 RepID=A0ABC8JZ59_ERUVS|nr:unnamed protein product [Eruca vesicaria subsp. sativa]
MWEHVVGMGLGAVFANRLVKWDVKLKKDLEAMLDKARAANESRYFGMSLSFLKNEIRCRVTTAFISLLAPMA